MDHLTYGSFKPGTVLCFELVDATLKYDARLIIAHFDGGNGIMLTKVMSTYNRHCWTIASDTKLAPSLYRIITS